MSDRTPKKKLVLLGDSIRLIGYGQRVAQLLEDEFDTWQPTDNCRFASYLLRMLFDERANIQGADVVHFNAGLWDICQLFADDLPFTPIDEYVATLRRIAAVLKSYARVVIFSTSTPCRPENGHNDNAVIRRYNAAAAAALTACGVIVNDLYPIINADLDGNIAADHLHLSEKGIAAAADSVAECIRKNMPSQ